MMLNEFIPVDEKGVNQKCKMFLNKCDIDESGFRCNLCHEVMPTYNELMIHYSGDCEND